MQDATWYVPFSRTNLSMVRIIYCIPWDQFCQPNLSKSLPDHFKDMQQRATSVQSPGPALESGSLATGTANLPSERPKEVKGATDFIQHLGSHWMKHAVEPFFFIFSYIFDEFCLGF